MRYILDLAVFVLILIGQNLLEIQDDVNQSKLMLERTENMGNQYVEQNGYLLVKVGGHGPWK